MDKGRSDRHRRFAWISQARQPAVPIRLDGAYTDENRECKIARKMEQFWFIHKQTSNGYGLKRK